MWDTTGVDRDRIDELHRACVEAVEPAVERFVGRLGRSGFEGADGSLASLTPVTGWFLEHVAEPRPGVATSVPPWWNPEVPTAEHGHPARWPLTRAQIELVDEFQAYVSHVILSIRADARWVVFEGPTRDHRNGETMLGVSGGEPFAARELVYRLALDAVHFDRPVRVTTVHDAVFDWLTSTPA